MQWYPTSADRLDAHDSEFYLPAAISMTRSFNSCHVRSYRCTGCYRHCTVLHYVFRVMNSYFIADLRTGRGEGFIYLHTQRRCIRSSVLLRPQAMTRQRCKKHQHASPAKRNTRRTYHASQSIAELKTAFLSTVKGRATRPAALRNDASARDPEGAVFKSVDGYEQAGSCWQRFVRPCLYVN